MENPWDDLDENLSAYERNRLLWNVGRARFVDISHQTSADLDSDSRAVTIGDFDSDGRPDLIVQSVGGGPVRVFQNQWPQRNWLRVSLRGSTSNQLGLGARVEVEAGGQQQSREVYPLNSYRSQMPAAQLFGLADSKTIDRLTIYWPSGAVTTLENIAGNQHIRVNEQDGSWQVVSSGRPDIGASGN